MVTITLYTRQQKRHWCIEQSFGLCGRERGWDDLGEWHWNTYNIIYETSRQSRFDARYWMLGAGALGRPRGMVRGGRRERVQDGNTCIPVADSFWYMAKPIQYCKVKKKKSLNIWKFTVHILLKPGLENFEHYFTSMQLCGSLSILWHCLSLGSEWKLKALKRGRLRPAH